MNSHQDDARPCIPLGQIVATPGALEVIERFRIDASGLLWRHQHGDWGDLSEDDASANAHAATAGLRILSSYPVGADERIWIITEADRSVTTLLRPSEY